MSEKKLFRVQVEITEVRQFDVEATGYRAAADEAEMAVRRYKSNPDLRIEVTEIEVVQ